MDYKTQLSDDKSLVITTVHKPVTTKVAMLFTRESAELAKRHGDIQLFLIDVRGIRHVDRSVDDYVFAKRLHEAGRKQTHRVAVLVDPDDRTHHFIETVTRNQGFQTKIFDDYEEAINWLKGI